MEEEPPTPPTPAQPTSPFWLPSSSSRPHHRFRPTSALVFNTSFVVVILSISAIAFLAALTPSLLSYTSHVLRPTSIKKGWDSVNLLLVAFAVVCGFIGRKDGTSEDEGQGFKDAPPQTPRLARSELSYNNWYPYGVQANTNTNTITNNINGVQLRRNFSSHPDLRQEISWENDMRPRYFDDSYVGNYESPRLVTAPAAAGESFRSQKVERDEQNGSEVEVASALLQDSAPPPSPSAPDSKNQELQSVRRRGRRKKRLAAQSQPPSPPEMAEVGQQDDYSGEESARSTPKKRGGVTKDIISSIYQSKRKKNRNRRSHESLEDFVHPPNPNPNPSFAPPPPPPPPPPPSFFHNIFSSKKEKRPSKKGRSSASHSIASFTKTKTRFTPNRANLHLIDQTAGDGSESPWIPIPPPPPPPFKFRSWKFTVEGDYVNIANSPKCGGVGDSDSDASTPMAQPPVSCPSPDVNHKAEDFIAMFKAKLKLEKMNSIQQRKEAGIGFSPLGPDSSPSPT